MREPKFERWASGLFAVLLVVIVLAALAALVASGDLPPGERLLILGGVPIAAAILLIAIGGLAGTRPWARPLALALLWTLVLAGIVRFIAALGTSLVIPLEAIAAALVLRMAEGGKIVPRPAGRDRWIVVSLAGLYLIATLWPAASAALLRPGASIFAVGPDALDLSVTVDCSDATGDEGIRVEIEWTWRERDVMPGSTDGLLVQWAPAGDGEAPYYDQTASAGPPGVWDGLGSPAAALIQPIAQSMPYGRTTTFGIDVAGHGQFDGKLAIVLRPSDSRPHGSVQVLALYAHLDRWTLYSENPESCAW